MEVQELKQLIKSNKLPNFLIFTGEEWGVQKIYVNQIAKLKNLQIRYTDSVSNIWTPLTSKSLFDEPALYVVRDDKELMTNDKIQVESFKNMLILILTTVDNRLKFIKQHKDSIVEFNTLKSDVLKRYIQKEIALSDRNCNILMEICDYNYGHCLLEIDKIWKYVDGCVREYGKPCNVDMNIVFKSLLEDGTLYIPPRDTIWEFIKAFLQNKPKVAYELYQDLKELETPTLSIISNLYNNAKQVLQVQTCTSKDISKSTGLTSWQIRNAKECTNRFSTRDLEILLRWLQRIERDIKTGLLEDKISIDYLFSVYF